MHRVIQTCSLLGNQARGLPMRITCGPLRHDGERETADCGNRLAELVVQFMRDQSSLLFDTLFDEVRHFAPLFELGLGLERLALGLYLILHGLCHPVERAPDGMGFESGQLW